MAVGDSFVTTGPLITIVAALAIIAMAGSVFSDIARRPGGVRAETDFTAFYCGPSVARAHQDPYALSALLDCETQQVRGSGNVPNVGIIPDPMPGFSMTLLAPLTALPYRTAVVAWIGVLLAAIAGTALILARLTGVPGIAVGAILAFIDGAHILPNGQLAPVLCFGLALAADGLVR